MLQFFQRPAAALQKFKVPAGNQNFLERHQQGTAHRGFQPGRGGDHTKIHQPAPQRTDGLWGGMVGNAQPHAGVTPVEFPQLIQQKHIQSGLAGANGQRAAFQRGNARQLAFPRLQLLLGDFHVGKQHFALRRHRHAAGAAHQQLAAQLFLQPVQGAGHIGLAHAQHIGRAGYTVIFADIVK